MSLCVFCVCLVAVIQSHSSSSSSPSPSDLELYQVVYVSRHGIRSPYPPNYGSLDDFSAYTNKEFPSHTAWGMSYNDFTKQKLTPHGKRILPYVGSYFAERWIADGLDLTSCQNIMCYADDSSRDIDTAKLWLEGFGCNDISVKIVNKTTNSGMLPIVYDLFNSGCPIATEEQTLGLFGGNVDALTNMYATSIELIMETLDMPPDASVCALSNPNFNPNQDCTLFETGYRWTGYVYDGGFKCPTYYSRYFSEYFMLQYLSNVTDWAFGLLTPQQLLDINAMHIKTHELGTNYWNSLTYSSEQLAYIVATMEQIIHRKTVSGCHQDIDTRLLLLFSHDANIQYLQRLLNLDWIPGGYSEGVADPSGALIFELWKSKVDESFFVKIHYDIATPDQQRYGERLTIDNPPSVSTLIIPECGDIFCPWEFFKEFSLSRVDPDCIQEPLQSTIRSMSSSEAGNESDSAYISTLEICLITVLCCVSSFLGIIFVLHLKGYRMRKVFIISDKPDSSSREGIIRSSREYHLILG